MSPADGRLRLQSTSSSRTEDNRSSVEDDKKPQSGSSGCIHWRRTSENRISPEEGRMLSKEVIKLIEERLERKNDRRASVILGRILGPLVLGVGLAALLYL